MNQMVIMRPLIKTLRSTPIAAVCSQQHQHILAHRDDDKVRIPDEEGINRNLKALQQESDDNNNSRDGTGHGEDDFKELAQELNKEERLGEPMQQTLANILETVWQNPQSYEKMKDITKIYVRPENCSSLVVKKCSKKI